jgi:hypothetical protein
MNTLVIIPASEKETANELSAAFFDTDGGGEFTFTVGLVTPPDLETITHYWCGAVFSAEKRGQADVLAPMIPGTSLHDYDADKDPAAPDRILKELGLSRYSPPMEPLKP